MPAPATLEVAKHKITLAPPILVGRSKGYLWFPTLARLENGDVLATMSNYADIHVNESTGATAWSPDGGATWSALQEGNYRDVAVQRADGETILLPYYLYRDGDNLIGPYGQVARGKRDIVRHDGLVVSGWPRRDTPPDKALKVAGFNFNGQSVRLNDGRFLATLYGTYEGDKRYTLVGAVSQDGIAWKIQGTIAGADCPLEGREGPCEAALCRLHDGRLMCVFRNAGHVPFGQCFSSDEGQSWSKPVAMTHQFSVQPSLAVMANGTVALSGGRPGLFLYLNFDASGGLWSAIDLLTHHNAHVPGDKIATTANTSAYTEVVAIDAKTLLVIYDRLPFSWGPIPADSPETNSVWVVRVTVE